MIRIEKYHAGLKAAWDKFNALALNGTLLFYRDFMEYHADRFTDHSLLFYAKNKLIALLPLHEDMQGVSSHKGLTFGGLIISEAATTNFLLLLFEQLRVYLQQQQCKVLVYKAIPYIYYKNPNQADLFALVALQARLMSRTAISILDLSVPLQYNTLRKRCLEKAFQNNIFIQPSEAVEEFMVLVAETYHTAGIGAPTHTGQELAFLMRRFPAKITLLTASINQQLVGGVVLFDHGLVINLQYIATTQLGKKKYALDLLLHTVIHSCRDHKKYLSFGTSKDDGLYQINQNILRNKESYGARTVIQDVYEWPLS